MAGVSLQTVILPAVLHTLAGPLQSDTVVVGTQNGTICIGHVQYLDHGLLAALVHSLLILGRCHHQGEVIRRVQDVVGAGVLATAAMTTAVAVTEVEAGVEAEVATSSKAFLRNGGELTFV